MNKKHKHHDVIVAWAAGALIEWSFEGLDWRELNNKLPAFDEMLQYRIKPEPAKIYPVTRMDGLELTREYCKMQGVELGRSLVYVANAALRHAIDSGQLVEPSGVTVTYYGDTEIMARRLAKAESTLLKAGYTDNGGELWKPPLGRSPDQRAARDMAIAKAVRACYGTENDDALLKSVIGSVKE